MIQNLTVDQAVQYLLNEAELLVKDERVSLAQACSRINAQPQFAKVDVPGFDNSAMDGYALSSQQLSSAEVTDVVIKGRLSAGDAGAQLPENAAVEINTGAPMPKGADCILLNEAVQRHGDSIRVRKRQIKPGQHIRLRGEDMHEGERILEQGVRITPLHLAKLAAAGIDQLNVYRPLRVAVVTTGNELKMPGEPLSSGQRYDVNYFALTSMLTSLGCEVVTYAIVEDQLNEIQSALAQACQTADMILTSGGVSVGSKDYIKQAISEKGEVQMWRVAVKPGKPIAFARVGGRTPLLALPGNPVALVVAFCLFARPFILRSSGLIEHRVRAWPVRAASTYSKVSERCQYLRAKLLEDEGGAMMAEIYQNQGSAMVSSLSCADGLVCVEARRRVEQGDVVSFFSFSDLFS